MGYQGIGSQIHAQPVEEVIASRAVNSGFLAPNLRPPGVDAVEEAFGPDVFAGEEGEAGEEEGDSGDYGEDEAYEAEEDEEPSAGQSCPACPARLLDCDFHC